MLKCISFPLAVVIALVAFAQSAAQAQEPNSRQLKPIVTVAFSGYDELVSDLNFVGNLAGNPQLGLGIEMMITMAAGGNELKSLDKSKPWGALVTAEGPQARILGFLPLGDLAELREILESSGGQVEEADGGRLAITVQGQKVYLKGEAGWVFVSSEAEGLDTLPKDPAAALGGLEKSYNLAVRLDIQNIPEMIRGLLLGLLKSQIDAGMMRMPGESDEQFTYRTKMADQTFQQVQAAVSQLESIQLGLAIDEEKRSVNLDVDVTALPDTEIADHMAATRELTTDFAGFFDPQAAFSLIGVGQIQQGQVEQALAVIETFRENVQNELEKQGLSEAEAKTARQLVDDSFAVVTSTLKQGKVDGGFVWLADDEEATWLGGFRVADGTKIESILKVVMEEAAKEKPELKESVQFNVGEHAGVRLHTLILPMDKMPPPAEEVFGEELTIVLGTADQAVYMSMAGDALEKLKNAIDDSAAASGENHPPLTVTVSVHAYAQLLAKYSPDPQVRAAAAMVAEKLADTKGKDRVVVTMPIEGNTQRTRIEIEEGALKLFGILPAIFMGAAQMGE